MPMPRLSRHFGLIMWAIVLGLLAMAYSPALTRSHVEGFSYFTETMARLYPDTASFDPLWPVNAQFFYASRPGVVWALVPLTWIAPGSAYNLLMWLTMPAFLAGVVCVAKRWSQGPWLAAVASLLVLPVAQDVTFFHNDNIVAITLSLWGIYLLLGSDRPLAIFCAGALVSFAMFCRLDQLLLFPLFAGLAASSATGPKEVLTRWGLLILSFVVVTGLAALIDPAVANPFERIAIATGTEALWDRGRPLPLSLARDARTALVAFGVGAWAILLGVLSAVLHARSADNQRRRVFQLVLLIVYPGVIYLFTVGKYYDPRGYLTMMPMIATLAALGLRYVANASGPAAWGSRAVIAAMLLVPGYPTPRETESAPPTTSGRIWYGPTWRLWQRAKFHAPEATVARLVDTMTGQAKPMIVLTADWNDDRRLQYALVQGDFAPKPMPDPTCADIMEYWVHPDGARLYHLRAHFPFLSQFFGRSAALMLNQGFDCLDKFPSDARFAIRPVGETLFTDLRKPFIEMDPDEWYEITETDIGMAKARAREMMTEFHDTMGPDEIARRVEQMSREALDQPATLH